MVGRESCLVEHANADHHRRRRILVDQNTETTGDVVVVDGRIASSGGREAGSEILDAEGGIVTPGLINAHHHLLQTAFRTLPGTRGVPMREWLGVMASAYTAAGLTRN